MDEKKKKAVELETTGRATVWLCTYGARASYVDGWVRVSRGGHDTDEAIVDLTSSLVRLRNDIDDWLAERAS